MTLTSEQNDLIFDYFFRCADQQKNSQGLALIASNLKAAELYNTFKQAFSQLDHLRIEECPSELVDMTLARLKLAFNPPLPASAQRQLQ